MELEDALKGGTLPTAAKPAESDDDLELLYEEFKKAPDSASGLRALRQLVRRMK